MAACASKLARSARDGDAACHHGFGLALKVELDDLAAVDTRNARYGLGHDDLSAHCDALQPRRGVHDVANRGEVADFAFADNPDVCRADVKTDAHLQLGPPRGVAPLCFQYRVSVAHH